MVRAKRLYGRAITDRQMNRHDACLAVTGDEHVDHFLITYSQLYLQVEHVSMLQDKVFKVEGGSKIVQRWHVNLAIFQCPSITCFCLTSLCDQNQIMLVNSLYHAPTCALWAIQHVHCVTIDIIRLDFSPILYTSLVPCPTMYSFIASC